MPRVVFALAIAAFLASSALLVPVPSLATDTGEDGPAADAGASSPEPCTPDPRRHGEPCTLGPDPSPARGRAAGGIAIWHPDRILDAGAPLSAVVAADFVPARPGNETLAGDVSGRLWLAWRENHNWRSQVAWSAEGNLTSLA